MLEFLSPPTVVEREAESTLPLLCTTFRRVKPNQPKQIHHSRRPPPHAVLLCLLRKAATALSSNAERTTAARVLCSLQHATHRRAVVVSHGIKVSLSNHSSLSRSSSAEYHRRLLLCCLCSLLQIFMASSAASRSFSWSTLSTDFYYRPQAEISNVGTYRIVTVHPAEYHDPIRCSLSEVSLKDTSVKFIALSYCWNSSAAEQTIWCDGRPLKVTANLFAALRNARPRNVDVRLWIDQVCVDQTNIIDRNEQVSKMGHIFRAASGVIVWLGEASPGSSAAMELPRMIKRYWTTLYRNPNELTDSRKTPPECDPWGEGAWPAFLALLNRPWWKRLWVSNFLLSL